MALRALRNWLCSCGQVEQETDPNVIQDETSRLIPDVLRHASSPTSSLFRLIRLFSSPSSPTSPNHRRLQERLGTIVRAKERSLHLPPLFFLVNQHFITGKWSMSGLRYPSISIINPFHRIFIISIGGISFLSPLLLLAILTTPSMTNTPKIIDISTMNKIHTPQRPIPNFSPLHPESTVRLLTDRAHPLPIGNLAQSSMSDLSVSPTDVAGVRSVKTSMAMA